MAYIDLRNTIDAGLKRWGTPTKNYGKENARRGFYGNWNELNQQLNAADYEKRGNIRDLSGNVNSMGYDTRNVYGSYGQDVYKQGLGDVNYNYGQRLQSIQNAMTGLQDNEYAYLNRPKPTKPDGPPKMPDPYDRNKTAYGYRREGYTYAEATSMADAGQKKADEDYAKWVDNYKKWHDKIY